MYGNVLQSSKTTLSTKISPLSSQQRRAYTLHSPSDSELLTLFMHCGAKTLWHHAQWTVLNYCSPLHDQSHNKAHLCPRDVPCPARGSGGGRSVKPWWSVNRVEITDDDVEADERRGVAMSPLTAADGATDQRPQRRASIAGRHRSTDDRCGASRPARKVLPNTFVGACDGNVGL